MSLTSQARDEEELLTNINADPENVYSGNVYLLPLLKQQTAAGENT